MNGLLLSLFGRATSLMSASVDSGRLPKLVDECGKAALVRLLMLGRDILVSRFCRFASDERPEVDMTDVSASSISPLSPSSRNAVPGADLRGGGAVEVEMGALNTSAVDPVVVVKGADKDLFDGGLVIGADPPADAGRYIGLSCSSSMLF